MRDHGGGDLAELPTRLIVGRPVNFAGDATGSGRWPSAATRPRSAGSASTDIRYAYEPVAAAFFFARKLAADATVMVADFGGGTSDFSIVRFKREAGEVRSQALANSGAPVAGDAFDYRIIDHLVSPELGKGTSYRAFDNVLPIPARYYAAFARWEQLALLRASRDMRDIRGLVRTALEPEKLARLVEILDHNHGYRLYQAVSRLKEALSAETRRRSASRPATCGSRSRSGAPSSTAGSPRSWPPSPPRPTRRWPRPASRRATSTRCS